MIAPHVCPISISESADQPAVGKLIITADLGCRQPSFAPQNFIGVNRSSGRSAGYHYVRASSKRIGESSDNFASLVEHPIATASAKIATAPIGRCDRHWCRFDRHVSQNQRAVGGARFEARRG